MEEAIVSSKSKRGGQRPGAGKPRGIKKEYETALVMLPVEYKHKLKDAAEKHGTSVSKFVQYAINSELEK